MIVRKWIWRGWLGFAVTAAFAIVSLSVLSLAAGYWIYCRFGNVPAWLIVMNMSESPSVLPMRDLLILSSSIAGSVAAGGLIAFACLVVGNDIKRRHGPTPSIFCTAMLVSGLAYGSTGVFEVLDGWFAIRHEIACRSIRSDFFARNFHRVEPSEVTFPDNGKNLLVIVSESLEEGFSEGALASENLLPELSRWREACHRVDYQCQVAGSSFTSAALTCMFYGIPRLRLDGSVTLQDSERYPRYSIPSLWDVFLHHGYQCAYVQGGDFEFGSKGRLFPDADGFREIGFDDMRDDPDYLAEPQKHEFGVNDEVMFKHFKRETLRLAECGRPFILFGLTMNPHCPDGWCSASSPHGNRGTLAESILAQDRMISEFLAWFSKLKCAKNTVVVVVGDHHYWGRNFAGKSPRRVFNAVRVPGAAMTPFARDRKFATFDWAPTFIELAGGKLPGDGHFGMGVSLLRGTETLLENVSIEEFDSKMQSSLSDYWDIVLRNN